MEIIYIPFKQSYWMFHSLEVASWRNIPKTKILCIQNAPRKCDLQSNNLSHVHTPCFSWKQHKASFNLHYQILVWLPSSSRVPQTPEQLSPDKPALDQQMCHINCKISHTNKRYTCIHTLNRTSRAMFL